MPKLKAPICAILLQYCYSNQKFLAFYFCTMIATLHLSQTVDIQYIDILKKSRAFQQSLKNPQNRSLRYESTPRTHKEEGHGKDLRFRGSNKPFQEAKEHGLLCLICVFVSSVDAALAAMDRFDFDSRIKFQRLKTLL